MTPGFFDVVKLDGAGCTERTVKPSGFTTAKKTKSELLILADTGHWAASRDSAGHKPALSSKLTAGTVFPSLLSGGMWGSYRDI